MMNRSERVVESLKPTLFYRGYNPGDTRTISTGDDYWDGLFFLSSSRDKAYAYGSKIEVWEPKSGAKILYEGTREFQNIVKGVDKGINMLKWASSVVRRAEKEGYDAVWFKRQGDLGTAVINRTAFVKRENS